MLFFFRFNSVMIGVQGGIGLRRLTWGWLMANARNEVARRGQMARLVPLKAALELPGLAAYIQAYTVRGFRLPAIGLWLRVLHSGEVRFGEVHSPVQARAHMLVQDWVAGSERALSA